MFTFPAGSSGGRYGSAGRPAADPAGRARSPGSARRPRWRGARHRDLTQAAGPPAAAARARDRGIASGLSQRCCSSWRLPSRNHASRPCVRADDLVRVELERHLIGASASGSPAGSGLSCSRRICSRAWRKNSRRPSARAQLLGQLITTRLAEGFVLGLVGRPGLGQDLPGDLLEPVVDLRAGVPRDPGAVDRHHPRLHQPRPITQLQHLGEQVAKRPLVPTDEPRDRRVIRNQVAGDHAVGHVLAAVTLDRPRRPHPWSRTRTRSAPPSSTAHTPRDRDHRPDKRRRTPTGPSRRPRRSQTTPDDPPAATPGHPAATKTPAHDSFR